MPAAAAPVRQGPPPLSDRLRAAPVTAITLLAIVVAYLAQNLNPSVETEMIQFGALQGLAVADGDWWRLVTTAFLHADLFHVGFNGYLLWALGNQLERMVGSVRFGLILLGSVLGGSLGALLLAGPRDVTIGASGGVFGLFAAFAVLLRLRGVNPFRTSIGTLILLNLVFTFIGENISIGGHLGGLALGGILAGVSLGVARAGLKQAATASTALLVAATGLGALVVAATRFG